MSAVGRPEDKREPQYSLEEVRGAASEGRLFLTRRVRRHLAKKGWSESLVVEVLASLRSEAFHKSQAHPERDGVWLDIYRPCADAGRLYVKFVRHENGYEFIVLSFCRDGEAH